MDLLYWLKPTVSTGVYIVHQPVCNISHTNGFEGILALQWAYNEVNEGRFAVCHISFYLRYKEITRFDVNRLRETQFSLSSPY